MLRLTFMIIPLLFIILSVTEHSLFAQATGSLAIGLNRIEGRVTDQTNMGVNNVYVELYNNFGSLVARQRSSGQGRFSFRGMGPGRYTVVVKPFGTNLLEDSKEIEINNQYSRSDTVMVDFRLRPDDRFRNDDPGVVGTVFAQEVPEEAVRHYKAGVNAFRNKPEKAFADFEEAIRLFPSYFDALAALGKGYVIKGKYDTGYPYLLRAIDVNPKCSDCYYSLALAFYKLNELPAAIKAIDAAVLLQPQAATIRLLQGIIYRMNGDFAAAEKALLLAKTLSKTPAAEVHYQLSHVYNRLGKNVEAAAELELYLKTKSDISDAERQQVKSLIAKLRKQAN